MDKYNLLTEEDTKELADKLAANLKAGDIIFLSGNLGAGKTTFCRYLIQTLAGDPTLEVVSPSFSILQYYDDLTPPILHADLYRLQSAHELEELDFDSYLASGIILIEWPEIAVNFLPKPKYALEFVFQDGVRYVNIYS